MRTYALALAAAALFAFPASSQGIQVPGIVIGPGGVAIGDDDEEEEEGASLWECVELRRACLHKEALGEEGQGNCRIYRETCRE